LSHRVPDFGYDQATGRRQDVLRPLGELTFMDSVLRLLLRFILVPLGYFAAVIAGSCIILFGSWKAGAMIMSDNPDTATAGVFMTFVMGAILLLALVATMWMIASIGILISEAFAIRSWIFHALNGAVSAWIGAQLFGDADKSLLSNEPLYIVAAGLAGGFAYWAIAGWNAGFWKPVFKQTVLPPLPLAPPANDPFNPPAPTKV
jgi:hypothetical protein